MTHWIYKTQLLWNYIFCITVLQNTTMFYNFYNTKYYNIICIWESYHFQIKYKWSWKCLKPLFLVKDNYYILNLFIWSDSPSKVLVFLPIYMSMWYISTALNNIYHKRKQILRKLFFEASNWFTAYNSRKVSNWW